MLCIGFDEELIVIELVLDVAGLFTDPINNLHLINIIASTYKLPVLFVLIHIKNR